MRETVSVVMTAYKRPKQLERTLKSIMWQHFPLHEIIVVEDGHDGDTEEVCQRFPVKYVCRRDRPDVQFSNPSVPINMGLRRASGDIVVLQNAECEHVGLTLQNLTYRVRDGKAVFATVKALNEDGSFRQWYCHPEHRPVPWFFCGAMHRGRFLDIGGMDEDFTGPGYEDNDFAERMKAAWITFEFSGDATVNHQWHPCFAGASNMREVYLAKHPQ